MNNETRQKCSACGLELPQAIMLANGGGWLCPVDDPTGTAWPGRSPYIRQLARERGDDYARRVVADDARKLDDVFFVGEAGGQVYVQEFDFRKPLPPRTDLVNHSPSGFGWGYGGSGPAQLALALASWVLGDDALACEAYQGLKWGLVSRLRFAGPWRLSYWHVVEALREALRGRVD
jgi:hypothetical protein